MSTVSAANRLRDRVGSIPGTVLFVQAGYPDKILRFQVLPESLKKLELDKVNAGKKPGEFEKEVKSWPVEVNLDWGPAQEAWKQAQREFLLTARRDRPVPEPLPVAEDSHQEWSVDEEDVPVVENALSVPETVALKQRAATTCDTCTMEFKTEHALNIHKARSHK